MNIYQVCKNVDCKNYYKIWFMTEANYKNTDREFICKVCQSEMYHAGDTNQNGYQE